MYGNRMEHLLGKFHHHTLCSGFNETPTMTVEIYNKALNKEKHPARLKRVKVRYNRIPMNDTVGGVFFAHLPFPHPTFPQFTSPLRLEDTRCLTRRSTKSGVTSQRLHECNRIMLYIKSFTHVRR